MQILPSFKMHHAGMFSTSYKINIQKTKNNLNAIKSVKSNLCNVMNVEIVTCASLLNCAVVQSHTKLDLM